MQSGCPLGEGRTSHIRGVVRLLNLGSDGGTPTLTVQPGSFTEDLLRLLYRATELGSMTIEQRERYEATMRNELDISLEKRYVRDEALKEGEAKGRKAGRAEGLAEGRKEGAREIAQKMLAAGSDLAFIKEMTGVQL